MLRKVARRRADVVLPGGIEPTENQARALRVLAGARSAYVFGPPGSGKTTALDAVHRAEPTSVRWHFGDFYRALHEALPAAGRSLPRAVERLTGRARLVCFDELHLHDIADSLYLDAALATWARRGVRVVATSNYRPADLLPNPLLHDAALPVIARIESGFEVVELDDGVDYRAAHGSAHLGDPRGNGAAGFRSGTWTVAPPAAAIALPDLLWIHGRTLRVSHAGGQSTRGPFLTSFAELCERPWSAADYIDLLGSLKSLTVANAPDPAVIPREAAQRFANLVDAACDRDVRLDVRAAGPPQRLALAAAPPLDLDRTLSRLGLLASPTDRQPSDHRPTPAEGPAPAP